MEFSMSDTTTVSPLRQRMKARAMLALSYGCGLRAGEVVRLRAGDIDSEQMIIRIVQSKGRKDRHVMLPAESVRHADGHIFRSGQSEKRVNLTPAPWAWSSLFVWPRIDARPSRRLAGWIG